MIDLDKLYVRDPHVAWRIIEEEALLVDPRSGKIYPLNPVAARIWALLDSKNRPSEIVSALIEEFDAPPEKITQDAYEFMTQLWQSGLLKEEG